MWANISRCSSDLVSDVCAVAVDLAEELHVVVRVRVVKVRREHGAAARSLNKSAGCVLTLLKQQNLSV